MKQTKHAFSDIPQFSKFDQQYASGDPQVWNLVPYSPIIDSFAEIIENRKKADNYRETVTKVLTRQYADAGISDRNQLIERLTEHQTFTVCTAHQLNLFTGPLYVIYKIASSINLAAQINKKFPENYCIPVYVLGTEDHDFDEINHAHIFRNRLVWEDNDALAAGQLTTEKLKPLITELEEILGSETNAEEIIKILRDSFSDNTIYARGVQKFINTLFKNHEILILDMFESSFKEHFKDIFIKDLTEGWAHSITQAQIQKMEDTGLKIQAPPRPMNTFYLDDHGRHRIEREEEHFIAQDTDLKWTKETLIAEVNNHPERFSPNVILRPIYQERILPNLAYVGGGGELAYWIELPDLFKGAGVPFPMLVRRKSFHILDERSISKMQQLDLSIVDLFNPVDDTIKSFLHSESDVDLSIPKEKEIILNQLDLVIARAAKIDPTLGKSLSAEKTRWEKNLDQLESRLIRSQKSRMDSEVKQIRKLVDRQFPDGKLQERRDNFIPYYLQYGADFINKIVAYSDPLERTVSVIWESSASSE